MPLCAAAARPATYVTGVEIINAQGQAMTMVTRPIFVHSRPTSGPAIQGKVHMDNASKTTKGVYLFAKASMSFSVGLLLACASSTRRIRRATAEFSDVEIVWINSCATPALTVPPETVDPGTFCTGRDSPVREDSSTTDEPSTTTPSHGILSPVRTDTILPIPTDDAGANTKLPLMGSFTFARSGRNLTIADKAFLARAVDKVSSQSEILNRNVTAAASLYS
mmetsp:Transcript_23592/g.35016  ORF Transcript_23592/g.35016 Transcript_23592/m.35016 type:complete len:222 (+) Transcript_23592:120-785(+)